MATVKTIKNKIKRKKKDTISTEEATTLQMAFFDSIHFVPSAWDELIKETNLYLGTPYLKAIELNMENTMQFRYILFYKEREAVAIASFQIIELDSKTLDLDIKSKRNKYGGKFLDQLNIKCLINGTLFGSGETSFYFSDKIVQQTLSMLWPKVHDGSIKQIKTKDQLIY
jgi:hypothetical protein